MAPCSQTAPAVRPTRTEPRQQRGHRGLAGCTSLSSHGMKADGGDSRTILIVRLARSRTPFHHLGITKTRYYKCPAGPVPVQCRRSLSTSATVHNARSPTLRHREPTGALAPATEKRCIRSLGQDRAVQARTPSHLAAVFTRRYMQCVASDNRSRTSGQTHRKECCAGMHSGWNRIFRRRRYAVPPDCTQSAVHRFPQTPRAASSGLQRAACAAIRKQDRRRCAPNGARPCSLRSEAAMQSPVRGRRLPR